MHGPPTKKLRGDGQIMLGCRAFFKQNGSRLNKHGAARGRPMDMTGSTRLRISAGRFLPERGFILPSAVSFRGVALRPADLSIWSVRWPPNHYDGKLVLKLAN